jgi:hypothetical protein
MKISLKHIIKTIIYPYRRILIALGVLFFITGNIFFYFSYLKPKSDTSQSQPEPIFNTYNQSFPTNLKPISLTLSNSYGQVDISSTNKNSETQVQFKTTDSRPLVTEETSTDIKLISLERSGIDTNTQYYKNSSISLNPLQTYKEFVFSLQYSNGIFNFDSITSLESLFLKIQQASADITLPKGSLKSSQAWRIENINGDIIINASANTPFIINFIENNTFNTIPDWLTLNPNGSYISTSLRDNPNQPFITLSLSGNNNLYSINSQ